MRDRMSHTTDWLSQWQRMRCWVHIGPLLPLWGGVPSLQLAVDEHVPTTTVGTTGGANKPRTPRNLMHPIPSLWRWAFGQVKTEMPFQSAMNVRHHWRSARKSQLRRIHWWGRGAADGSKRRRRLSIRRRRDLPGKTTLQAWFTKDSSSR